MKKVVLLFLLCSCLASTAQNNIEPVETYDYYCIVYIGKWSKAYISMPFSEFSHAIMNKEGKKKSFNNHVDLLTYMSKQGWKYVESTTYDGNAAFLMKKPVRNDDEAKGDLLLESDFE